LIIVFVTIIATVYGFHLGQRLHFGCKKQRERAGENTAMLSSGKYRLQRLYYCIQPALWTAVWIGIPVGVIANFFGGSAPPFYDMAIAATNAVIFVSFCILGAFARWQSRRVFSMVEIDLVIIAISFLLALDNMRSFFEPLTRKIDAVSNLLDYNVYTFHITWWWVLYFLLSIPVSLILAVFIALVLTAVIAIDAMSATPTSMYFSED
jgi:hypothetical protein